MVESSKILTVSYGTFSCTLEGFNDSFGTMKAIAEYFRDLAADDRYFGAEPPAPDVAMLAKIAEREITRRVDARTEDGGIVLRASEDVAPAMPAQTTRPDPLQVAAAAVAPQVAPAPEDHIHDDFQTAHSDATANDMEPVVGPEVEDHVSSPLVASGQATPSELTFDDMAQDAAPDVPAHPDAESVAAKLQRIRAVVGKAPEKSEDTDFAEDLSADVMPDVANIDDSIVDEDVAVEPLVLEDEIDIDSPAIEMSGLDFGNQETEETSLDTADVAQDDDAMLDGLAAKAAPTATPVQEDVPNTVTKTVIRAQILRIRKSEAPKVEEPAVEVDTVDVVASEAAEDESFDDTAYNDAGYDDADYGYEEDLPNVATLDGVEDLEGFDAPISTSLSDDEEADLMEELAEVERDFAPMQPEAPVADQKPRASLPETDDATMSHILNQTDQQLNEPEGSRRRDAIAQLKAAVAATEAARQLGDEGSDKVEAEDAFRDDLKGAVKPTRPTAPARPARVRPSETRTERPRPAPLKLVASQRVDTPAPEQTSAPVLPRRVASVAEPMSPAAASSFAEFAEEMGATALADLLEAAAAYTSFVEGVEDFSRPQIMKKVQLSTETEFSREDGLRSFGTLLRQGRISKVRNGRFQVSEASRFKPESKAG